MVYFAYQGGLEGHESLRVDAAHFYFERNGNLYEGTFMRDDSKMAKFWYLGGDWELMTDTKLEGRDKYPSPLCLLWLNSHLMVVLPLVLKGI